MSDQDAETKETPDSPEVSEEKEVDLSALRLVVDSVCVKGLYLQDSQNSFKNIGLLFYPC